MLVAISIPIFTSQLEKSREAVDAANIRAEYAELMSEIITSDTIEGTYEVELKQTQSGWQNEFDFPENLDFGTYTPAEGDTVVLTWNGTDSKVTVAKKTN